MIYIAVITTPVLGIICVPMEWNIPNPIRVFFFESVDKRLSTHWMMNSEIGRGDMIHKSIVIKEWAEDRSFYERLMDGDQNVKDVFNVHRQTMDDE